MHIEFVEISNFRKLKSCHIDFDTSKTVFVGANNCGKTSAMDALIRFLKDPKHIQARDFTLSNWDPLNKIGEQWVIKDATPDLTLATWENYLPSVDVWLKVPTSQLHLVSQLIPTLDWREGLLGVRFRLQPKNIEKLYTDYLQAFLTAALVKEPTENHAGVDLQLWPQNLLQFLEKRLSTYFDVFHYLLDESRYVRPDGDYIAKPQPLIAEALPLDKDPFKGLIKIDVITAQRGFSDSNADPDDKYPHSGSLTSQFKAYYSKHLDPTELPEVKDLEALKAMSEAQSIFDIKLSQSFEPSIKELEKLNYPGFGGNPKIKLTSKLRAVDGLNHGASIQFSLITSSADSLGLWPPLPEKYNGLGYQNLISMVFKLIGFRDDWMQVGKQSRTQAGDESEQEFEPLHLVLIEEPEAFLHAQVQQVFIRKAFEILRDHSRLRDATLFQTQLLVSTHSSHIAHEINFSSLRYFKRLIAQVNQVATSTVVNLSKTFGTDDETTRFAIRYLKTTHCDLFFADGVILLEGSVERMLIPSFIEKHFHELSSCYIALLEIGGRHSHSLRPLLENLGITTLIITDLDSIDVTTKKSKMPEKGKGYESSNTTLKEWLPCKASVDDLMDTDISMVSTTHPVRVCYQQSIVVKLEEDERDVAIIPYTFEIALAFDNIELFKTLRGHGLIKKFKEAAEKKTALAANEAFYVALENGKKAEFALELLYIQDPKALKPPTYIKDGLIWLKERLTSLHN